MKLDLNEYIEIYKDIMAEQILLYSKDLDPNGALIKEIGKIMITNLSYAVAKVKYAVPPRKWYIELSGSFKCDNETCDWVSSPNIIKEHYFLWRNFPCPKCGSNIFTDTDWISVLALNMIMGNPIIRFINWIGKKFNLKKTTFKVNMNGNGISKIDVLEEKDTK